MLRDLLPKITFVPIILLVAACNSSQDLAAEDENIGLEISKDTYSISEKIEIKITVIAEGISFHGPCDWWFEEVTDTGWQVVGECPKTSFSDEPFPQQSGDNFLILLPTSDTDNAYTYNYFLSTGIYRYAISYRMKSGVSISTSPLFEIVDD
jgi:hypothetical protein